MKTIANKLRQLRKEANLTLNALANEVLIPIYDTGSKEIINYKSYTGSFYSSIESGRKTDLSDNLIEGICDYFKISIDEFKEGCEEESIVEVDTEDFKKDDIPEPVIKEKPIEIITKKRSFISVPSIGGRVIVRLSSIDSTSTWEHYAGIRKELRGLIILSSSITIKTTLQLEQLNKLLEEEGLI